VLSLQIEISFDKLYVEHARVAAIDACVLSIGGIHIHDLSKGHWRYTRGAHLDAKGPLMFGDALYSADIDRILAPRALMNKRCKRKLTFPSVAIPRQLKRLLAAFFSDRRDGSVGAQRRF